MPKLPACPNEFTIDFARKLIEALGEDSSPIQDNWCWKDLAKHYLAKHYPNLRKKVENYFEKAKTGDPSYAAYLMVRDCESSREWADRTAAA